MRAGAEPARPALQGAARPIDEGLFVDINGSPQWITVRSRNRNNPALLWLHGGPGIAMSNQAPLFAKWEQDFTIIQWDQPGGGATYARSGPEGIGELSVERYVRDAIAVAEWSRRQLGCRKLVVVGTSWGTVLGLELASRRPDLVAAYVGTAQFISGSRGARLGYDLALKAARERKDSAAVAELMRAGPPPYDRFEDFIVRQKYVTPPGQKPSAAEAAAIAAAGKLLAPPPPPGASYVATGLPKVDVVQGFLSVQRAMFKPTAAFEAESLGLTFKVPMFFFQGADDWNTPTALVREYVARIRAPVKKLVIIPGADHMVVVFNDQLLALLDRYVRPLALSSAACTGSAAS
ncbi:MAG TPA: alpha/beta hydrolase [Caulobacteraceae bacterium]|jgi:pimeloyl-ACP methyl ester carboxylesterase|nr:alpha/beta hydrolase [Caulobacteraceae bacterium]